MVMSVASPSAFKKIRIEDMDHKLMSQLKDVLSNSQNVSDMIKSFKIDIKISQKETETKL
jgi:hypothetical protein